MNTAFTTRNVAKWMVQSIIATKTADFAADTISNYTRFDEDDLIVKLGAGSVGWFVSSRFESVTDSMVDKTADFIVDKRAKRAARRNTQQD